MEHVFPKLREFCSLHGRDLQIYDLHWGVKDSVSNDHGVPEVIGRTIAKCQESTMGINLLVCNSFYVHGKRREAGGGGRGGERER